MTGQGSRESVAAATLLVCEQGDPGVDIDWPVTRLEYRFIAQCPEDGFSAWPAESGDGSKLLDVEQGARSFSPPFLKQGLNRLVAQALLRNRASVLVVSGLWGCTIDLPRIANLLGVQSVFIFQGEDLRPLRADPVTDTWLRDALATCRLVCAPPDTEGLGDIVPVERCCDLETLPARLRELAGAEATARRFDYSTYEFALRDHPLLYRMQTADVRYFRECEHVLDVACGAGIFLDALRQEGIRGTGVERDARISAYASGMGLEVVNDDAIDYLESPPQRYDGIYCSHFVEHLPVDVLQRFIHLLYAALCPGGLAVLVFPDPESIRSQLLGFWRDPEHVRFYHPDLVTAMATVAGFSVEATNYDTQPHRVIPFEEAPPPLPEPEPLTAASPPAAPVTLMGRFAPGARRQAEEREAAWHRWADEVVRVISAQQACLAGLKARTDTLWSINATWAWHDNATVRLRRPDSRRGSE